MNNHHTSIKQLQALLKSSDTFSQFLQRRFSDILVEFIYTYITLTRLSLPFSCVVFFCCFYLFYFFFYVTLSTCSVGYLKRSVEISNFIYGFICLFPFISVRFASCILKLFWQTHTQLELLCLFGELTHSSLYNFLFFSGNWFYFDIYFDIKSHSSFAYCLLYVSFVIWKE